MIRPGMFISDRYEIIDKVGSGGMADVYKAKCHRLNRFVAIKVLKTEYSDDKNFVAKFRGEAQSAAGLSHPNIVNVYDVGDDDGLYYIVMELVEGITLKSFIEKKGRLEVKETIGIAIQIAQGLEAAHANHIIHRDIKPQNIIISREGKVKVTDFGIAKAASSNTITSNAMGSVHYISPEQARGGYSDEKSDIYSLGVTMYEMLSGKVPFAGDNTVSVALLHIQGEAMPLRDLDPSIPVSLDRIVQKCMQKKPERRYLSATEVIADLKKAITNPNGDFVKITPMVVNDSPTINISDDEVSHIKSAVKVNPAPYNARTEDTGNLYEQPEEDEDGEDGDGDMDPKLEKIVVVFGVVAAVISALVIIFLIGKLVFGGKKAVTPTPTPSAPAESLEPGVTDTPEPDQNTPELTIPAVVGRTLEEAQQMLKDAGYSSRFEEEESDYYEKGMVIKQDPDQDTPAEAGTIVVLTVSSGSPMIPVPDITGKPKNEAHTALDDVGIKYNHKYENSDEYDVDHVIRTEPAKDSQVKKGDTIVIILSNGPAVKMVYVPDLSNKSKTKAEEVLNNAGLSLGKVSYNHSDDVAKDKVMYQSYSVNEQVEEGTTIDITLSLGPEVVPVTYKYVADVKISYNPFDFEDETGIVKIVLIQDGQSKVVFEEDCDYYTFPRTISMEGYSESQGALVMYLDGVDLGADLPSVIFQKVEQ